jgi:hypothetical protein
MSRSISLEIPDNVYAAIERVAAVTKQTPAEWMVRMLTHHLPARTGSENGEDRCAAEEFRQLFGSVQSGDPRAADNERIDADLARAYACPASEKS